MTAIDICNMALSGLGHERTIASLDEPGKEASLCRVWLAQARQSVLGAAGAGLHGEDGGAAGGGDGGGVRAGREVSGERRACEHAPQYPGRAL